MGGLRASVPSGRVTFTFTLPSRTTYTVSPGSSTVMTWVPAGKVLRRTRASILYSCSAGRPRNSAPSENILDSELFATMSPPLPAKVVRSGTVAFSKGILCCLLRRHHTPLRKRRFPRRLVELGARGGHAALVVRAGFGCGGGTDALTQGLRRPPQPRRSHPLPPRPGQAGEAFQAVDPRVPVTNFPIQRQAFLEESLCQVVLIATPNRQQSQPPYSGGDVEFVGHLLIQGQTLHAQRFRPLVLTPLACHLCKVT